jgi:peptidoglycan-associated lipoprotein
MKTTILALAALAAVGCHADKKQQTTPVVESKPAPATSEPKPAPVVQDTAVSSGLAVSPDLADMCGIKPTNHVDPRFDYDKDELTADDRAVLDLLATCLTTGKLKGKAVSLIGRADPRGTDEYNLGLGSRRANSVSQYLGRLGVGAPQLAVTTRGALDATGTDEAGWRHDRRVDVQLKQN